MNIFYFDVVIHPVFLSRHELSKATDLENPNVGKYMAFVLYGKAPLSEYVLEQRTPKQQVITSMLNETPDKF